MYQVHFDPLPNGVMRIYAPMPERRRVSITAGIRSGSCDDPTHKEGLVHWLEHMRLRAAGIFDTWRSFSRQIDRCCNDANAETDKTSTLVYLETIDRYCLESTSLMGLIMLHPKIDQPNADGELGRIFHEIGESLDAPDDYLDERLDQLMFPQLLIGRAITGDEASLRRMTLSDLHRLHQEQLVGSRLVLSVAGAFDPQVVGPALERLFGRLPIGQRPNRPRIDFTGVTGQIALEERELEHVHFIIGFPCFDFNDPDAHILGAIRNYLSVRSSSLLREIIDGIGDVYTLRDFYQCWDSIGQINWRCSTSPGKFQRVICTIARECYRLGRDLISPDDLELIKRNMEIRAVYRFDDPLETATFLAREYLNRGSCLLLPEYLQRIESITVEDLQRVAKRIFEPSRLSMVAAGPFPGLSVETVKSWLTP